MERVSGGNVERNWCEGRTEVIYTLKIYVEEVEKGDVWREKVQARL